jgi:ethanolamine utilization protein EutQ (cupin superfamily)
LIPDTDVDIVVLSFNEVEKENKFETGEPFTILLSKTIPNEERGQLRLGYMIRQAELRNINGIKGEYQKIVGLWERGLKVIEEKEVMNGL